jgi:hypothetical protein
MKRTSAKSKQGGAAKRSAKPSWKSNKILLGVAVYLAIGLIWSIVGLVSVKSAPYSCPDPARPGFKMLTETPNSNACRTVPEASSGAKVASVGVSTVLWLPLLIISSFTE